MTIYPTGYNTTKVDIDELFRRHHLDKMHPEFARRLRAWLIANNGRVGIGGSWRATQPAKPGFAPEGKSFHQTQTFGNGRQAFCAVDLVHVNGSNKHRSPTWNEVPKQGTAEAAKWGLHCNVPKEPWHIQPIELDGWGTWNTTGRKDFGFFAGPIQPVTEPTPILVFAYPGTPLKIGSQGDAVKLLQAVVGATQDGNFAGQTDRLVRAWQQKNGLKADGIVGPATWKKMFG